MYLVVIGWLYVALMMALAEALHPDGSVLGAVFTFVLYGLAPTALVSYLLATPMRRKARRAAELAVAQAPSRPPSDVVQPDQGGHAPADSLAPERKES